MSEIRKAQTTLETEDANIGGNWAFINALGIQAGLKDANVVTPILAGDALNKVFNMINQSIIGNANTMLTAIHSAGLTNGGTISDAGGGNIDVAVGTGFIRSTNEHDGILFEIAWSQSLGNAIPSGQARYVGIEYNAGTPQVVIKTTDTWNYHDEFPLGSVVNEGGILHILNDPATVQNGISHSLQRFYGTAPLQRDERIGGLILGETGTRNVTITAGTLWDRFNEFSISAIDTSVADTFDTYVGVTQQATGQTQWDNANYDNGGSLTALSANRYANLWFYLEADGNLVMVYGTAQYVSSANAENEAVPSTIPLRLQTHGKLIGRLIFQEGAATATAIESVFDISFATTLATDHGNLAGLANDDHIQYALLGGRSGGQLFIGGTQANDDLTFQTTVSGTKGNYIFTELNVANGIVQTDGSGVLSSSVTLPNGTLATTQSTGDNSTKIATTAYVDAILAANDALVFKGVFDASVEVNFPVGDAGDTYKVSVAGTVNSVSLEIGDMLICVVDSTPLGTPANWAILQDNMTNGVNLLTNAEVTQLANIDTTTISITQWGYLGASNQGIATGNSPTFAGLTLSGLTLGSVVFAGASGVLSEDNTNFFWDDSTDRLGIGTNTPSEKLEVAGNIKSTVVATDGFLSIDNASSIESVKIDTNGVSFLLGGNFGVGINIPSRKTHFLEDTALTNTVNYNTRLTHTTSETPANNLGVGIEFEVKTSAGNNEVLGTLEVIATDVTAASEDGAFVFKLMTAGTAATEKMIITSTGVGIGILTPDASALLDISSTTKGFLPPRMTDTQRDAISSPGEGLIVYDTTNNKPDYYNGTVWRAFVSTDISTFAIGSVPFATDTHHLSDDNANFFWNNTTKRLGIGTNNPLKALDVNGDIMVRQSIFVEQDVIVTGNIRQLVHTDDVSNPPTDAELDAIYGTPATVGAGFTSYIDDNGAGTNFYEVVSDGTNWWVLTATVAA